MARLLTTGAEWNDQTADGWGGSATVVGTTVRSGSLSWQTTANQSFSLNFTQVLGRTYFFRVYFNVSALPTNATAFAGMNFGNYTVKLNTDGTLQLQFSTTAIGSPSAAISLNRWYRLELSFKIGSGSLDDSAEFRLDGVSIASETNQTRATTGSTNVFAGDGDTGSLTLTAFFDDVALNDDQGASQNTWPDSGKVVLLKPVSDNARGTGWVNDANAASGFFDATDNTPPAGIAQTTASTGLHQIQNATANANSNVDLNLTTYTTAGVGASDTVNVLVPIVATGAPVVTSAKAGTYGIVSNPAITNISLGAGGTSGAFWSGVAAGTYSTGWKWSFGTTTYAPSVTVGTSPVARITQVTSSTRIAMVCAMGMYVDYTPAAVAVLPIPNVNMAPQRA